MREHLYFDLLAWSTALVVGIGVWHWRLRTALAHIRARAGGGYFAALSAGSLLGAYGFGSLNLLLSGLPGP